MRLERGASDSDVAAMFAVLDWDVLAEAKAKAQLAAAMRLESWLHRVLQGKEKAADFARAKEAVRDTTRRPERAQPAQPVAPRNVVTPPRNQRGRSRTPPWNSRADAKGHGEHARGHCLRNATFHWAHAGKGNGGQHRRGGKGRNGDRKH